MLSSNPPILSADASSWSSSVVISDDVDLIVPTRTITQLCGPTAPTPAQSSSHTVVKAKTGSHINSRDPVEPSGTQHHPAAVADDARTALTEGVDPRFKQLYEAAHSNAPRCGNTSLQWMTIAQASETLRMPKTVVSSWASKGNIVTIKAGGHNAHRLVHLDNILAFMQDVMLRESDEYEARPGHMTPPAQSGL